MWGGSNNREERGAGGPVLRDPIARQLGHGQPPYNVKNRMHFNPNNNRNCNGNNNNFNQNNSKSQAQPLLFPPSIDNAPFPAAPSLFNQPPPKPAGGNGTPNFFNAPNPFMGQDGPPPFFNQPWQAPPNSFYDKAPPPPPNNKASVPFHQSSMGASSPLSARLLSIANSTGQSQSPGPSSSMAPVQRSSPAITQLMSMSVPPPPPSHHASPSYSNEFNYSPNTSKPPSYQTPPQTPPVVWETRQSGTSGSFKDSPSSPFNTPQNQSFGNNGNSPFTQQQQQQRNFFSNSRSEPQRPSSFLPNPMYSGPKRSNNNTEVQRNPNKTLLPTPATKLVPYPPPPPLKSSSPTPILRNPRGLSQSQPYSNFVRGNTSNSSHSNNRTETGNRALIDSDTFNKTSVVPYNVCDDEDEDEDDLLESGKTGVSTEESHDFFDEKIVQHFASKLNGKDIVEQMQQLLSHILLPMNYLTSRVNIVRNLHTLLTQNFQKCKISPYGADFIGIGNSDDSVNIFIDLTGNQGPSCNIESTRIEPSELTQDNVQQLLGLIQKDENHKFFGQIVKRTNYNKGRDLPVISFIHSDTQVRCNLRLDNYLLVQEAKVMQFILSLDTRISPLLGLVRYWSSVHKVLDTPAEDTKNRFITFLVLFFLARKKIVPTMAHLQSLAVKHEYFENLDISFCDDFSLVPRNENPALDDPTLYNLSTLALLKEFFRLFAEAKLEDNVVCTWNAEFIPKEHFNSNVEPKVLPPDLRKRYMFGVNGKLKEKRLDCGSRLCIQDFQDLTENLSLAIADYEISKFQYECEVALKKVESMMACGSGNLMDLFILSDYST